MDSDSDYDDDNFMYTLFSKYRRPYCAEKYNEKITGPYNADKSNDNTPGRAPISSSELIIFNKNMIINNNNNIYNIYVYDDDNNNLYVKYYMEILHLGLVAITLGVCICIDILFNYYKNQD